MFLGLGLLVHLDEANLSTPSLNRQSLRKLSQPSPGPSHKFRKTSTASEKVASRDVGGVVYNRHRQVLPPSEQPGSQPDTSSGVKTGLPRQSLERVEYFTRL